MLTRSFAAGQVDLRLTLGPLRHGPFDPTVLLTPAGALRATRTPAGPCTLRLRPQGNQIEATAWGPGSEWMLERAPRLVGIDDSHGGFRPRDRVMKELQRTLPGLRMCSSPVLFESLIPRIIEQKVTSREAHRSYARLVGAIGEEAPGPGGLRLLPSPESLATLPYHSYHPFGIEARRANIIGSVARRIPRLQEISDRSPSTLETVLTSLPGIGLWTARHILQCVVGDPDAVIVGDYHIPKTVSWLLAGEPRADDERMLELLEPYRGQRGRAVRMIMASGARAPAYGPRRALRKIEHI